MNVVCCSAVPSVDVSIELASTLSPQEVRSLERCFFAVVCMRLLSS